MDIPFYNNINLNNNKIINCNNPEDDLDVVNKLFLNTQLDSVNNNLSNLITTQQSEINERITNEVNTINTTITENNTQIHEDINTSITSNIINNLLSQDTTKSLSAKQGNLLKADIDLVSNKVDNITQNIYSLTKTPIGVYLNKTLYRQVINTTITAETTEEISIDLTSIFNNNDGNIINLNGFYIDTENITHWIGKNDSGLTIQEYSNTTHILKLQLTQELLTKLLDKDITIFIEYIINESEENE